MVCDGFLGLAASTSVGLGVPNIAIATVPGHTGVQSKEELRGNILGVTMDEIVDNLTREPETATQETEPGAYDIVVKGGFEEVNRYFYEHALSDGLPVVPPHARARRAVPAVHRPLAGRSPRHTAAGQPRRHDLEHRGEWRHGRLPA